MPAARPEFIHLSAVDVWAVIDDDGPVAAEVTRLVAAYTVRLMGCEGAGAAGALYVRVRCPIELVAVFMIVEGGAKATLVNLN